MDVALARAVRVAGGGQHHAEREAAVPFGLDLVELAGDGGFDQVTRSVFRRIMIGCVSGSPMRQLNSTTRGSALGVDHQAGVQEAGVGQAVGGHAGAASA
jgi:hypothetical protein